MRMLCISDKAELEDSGFLAAEAFAKEFITLNTRMGITPHPFLHGWLSYAGPHGGPATYSM